MMFNTVGFSDNNSALCNKMVAVDETHKEKYRDDGWLSTPFPSIFQLNKLLSVVEDNDIHFVKYIK